MNQTSKKITSEQTYTEKQFFIHKKCFKQTAASRVGQCNNKLTLSRRLNLRQRHNILRLVSSLSLLSLIFVQLVSSYKSCRMILHVWGLISVRVDLVDETGAQFFRVDEDEKEDDDEDGDADNNPQLLRQNFWNESTTCLDYNRGGILCLLSKQIKGFILINAATTDSCFST